MTATTTSWSLAPPPSSHLAAAAAADAVRPWLNVLLLGLPGALRVDGAAVSAGVPAALLSFVKRCWRWRRLVERAQGAMRAAELLLLLPLTSQPEVAVAAVAVAAVAAAVAVAVEKAEAAASAASAADAASEEAPEGMIVLAARGFQKIPAVQNLAPPHHQ